MFVMLSLIIMASAVRAACAPPATPTAAPPATSAPPAAAPTEAAPPPTEVMVAEPLVLGTTDSWSSFESAWVYSFPDWEPFHQCAAGMLNAVAGGGGGVQADGASPW